MNHEERDDLWELLGRARPVRVSPFFSRNVLRALREEKPAASTPWAWLLRRWPIAAAAVGVFVLAALALIPRPEPVDPIDALVEHVSASPDFAVIGNLDELLAAEESSVWLSPSVD